MSKRNLGVLFITLGMLGLALSIAADPLGLGTSPGLGWVQIAGAAGGLILAAWGATRLRGG
jgi:hypothetical protein